MLSEDTVTQRLNTINKNKKALNKMKGCDAGGSEGQAVQAPVGPKGWGLFLCDFSEERFC